MKENIKLYAKISGKAFLKWLFVLLSGSIISAILFLIIFFTNVSGAGGGHGNAYAFVINLAVQDLFGFLLFIGMPLFVFLYFAVANKIGIQTIIYEIWTNKAMQFVEPAIKKIADKITSKQNWMTSVSDQAMLRAKLLDENRNDKSNSSLNRRVLGYVFKKIKLDDIDFRDENLTLTEVLTLKLKNFISETTKPSFILFWVLVGVQFLLLILSIVFS